MEESSNTVVQAARSGGESRGNSPLADRQKIEQWEGVMK
jgi:hypothetical protein